MPNRSTWYQSFASSLERIGTPFVLIAVFSFSYFGETLVRASEKNLWYDELCTYYICRLPTFHESWQAVLHGADYNPPLFYVIHRASMAVFGDGQIAMRLPEILGFWMLCVSLFMVVNRRAGRVAGWAAMLLPLLTGAYFYAYDARPHGLVLGFCGLAVVCWQRFQERENVRWLLGLALALEAAFLNHCYAVLLVIPFALVETVRTVRIRAIRWRFWLILIVPAMVAVISFVPLLKSYQNNVQGTAFAKLFTPSTVTDFYSNLLKPTLIVILSLTSAFAFGQMQRSGIGGKTTPKIYDEDEAVLALSFLGLPFFGFVVAELIRGPFIPRYFLSAVIGLCISAGLAITRSRPNWLGMLVTLLTTFLVGGQATLVAYHRVQHRGEQVIEASSRNVLNTNLRDPIDIHRLLHDVGGASLPIIVPRVGDFLYLVHYWPDHAYRLFSVSTSDKELEYRLNNTIRESCQLSFNRPQTYADFLPLHSDFLLYGMQNELTLFPYLIEQGATIKDLKATSDGRFLATIHMTLK